MSCDTKNQIILHTATKHFANAGFDGARVDEIAAEAGVNKATLYYRIGNKEAIYEAIFVEITSAILEQVTQKTQEKDSPEAQLTIFANVFARALEDNIYIAPLILREVASGGTHMNETAMEKMHQIRAVLTQILKKGEENGSFHPSNPFLIHMIILGSLNFYSASASIRNKMSLTAETDNEKFRLPVTNVAKEIVNLILNSICINQKR